MAKFNLFQKQFLPQTNADLRRLEALLYSQDLSKKNTITLRSGALSDENAVG
jgi:hypothetical protein